MRAERDVAPRNLADVVRSAAAAAGDRPALIDAHGVRTWADLDAAADAGAATLAGYPAGERVVLALPTSPELAAALFAVLRAGLVAVPVNPQRTDLAWAASRVGAVATVTDHTPAGAAITSAQVAQWWRTPADRVTARAGGEDLALLARAARRPAPVMLSHRAMLGAAAALRGATHLDVRPTDRVLQVLPLFHVVGLVTAFLPAALAGAAVVIPDPAGGTGVEAALEAVRAHRVSVLPAEPTLYRQLDRIEGFERALATVRLMTSGSSPLDPADFAAIRRATGQAVREGYGISESAAAVTSTLMTPTARPGSVGLPYPGVEIRIADGSGESPVGGDDTSGSDQGTVPTDGRTVPNGDRRDGRAPDAAATGGDGAPGVEQESAGAHDAIGDDDATGDGDGVDDVTGDGDGFAAAGDESPAAGHEAARPGAESVDTSGLVLSGGDDDALADAAPVEGDVGPILIRGDTLFSGYWPDGAGGPGPDGWYATGDIGYLDDAGELHLVDRAAETVVVAGFTVYPREVEDVLVTHPYVADAAVVGVPGRAGPTVVAALVAQPGTRPTQGEMDDFLAERLPPFKRPTGYQVVDVLPRTEVGRLDRETVRRSYAERHGIALDAPARLSTAAGGQSDSSAIDAEPAHPGEAHADEIPDESAPQTAPEEAAGLDRLGTKLPSGESRSRRSAKDTDEDLF